jgi:phosphoribosylanthranilate isomerase
MRTPSKPERTRIKICGLTREQDVEAAVQAGADAVGFMLYEPSPRFVDAARAIELARRLPAFVTPVLVFVNAPPGQILALLDQLPHAMLQFHGDETPMDCLRASGHGKHPYMRAARIPAGSDGAGFDLLEYVQRHSQAKAILLDTLVAGYGGGGTAFNWSLLPTSVDAHLVLSGGLTPANVGDGIAQLRPRCRSLAVDVSSGVEWSKGIKDATKINQFVAAVRAADQQLAQA